MTRFRTTIFSEEGPAMTVVDDVGVASEEPGDPPNMLRVLERVSHLERQASQAASQLDKSFIEERIGKLTGGIARLKVVGSSSGELRERRDRAEDAICAVRGSIKHGVLPGGGWTMIRLAHHLLQLEDPIVIAVLCPALLAPIERLLRNAGLGRAEGKAVVDRIGTSFIDADADNKDPEPLVYDALGQKFVDPFNGGILDSVPAVLEALRNSLSIASLLGTLGAIIAFRRDHEVDRREAHETSQWLREVDSVNPADDRPL
jgi:chaperonin GroEL